MNPLETYRAKFDERAWQVFLGAVESARRLDHAELHEVHLLKELIGVEPELFAKFFSKLNIESSAFIALMDLEIRSRRSKGNGPIKVDSSLIELLKASAIRARAYRRNRIATRDLLVAFAQRSDTLFVRLLLAFGSAENQVASAMLDSLAEPNDASTSLSEAEGLETPFRTGQTVRIISGAFVALSGHISDVHPARSSVTVAVKGLRKEQLVELSYSAVQKIGFV